MGAGPKKEAPTENDGISTHRSPHRVARSVAPSGSKADSANMYSIRERQVGRQRQERALAVGARAVVLASAAVMLPPMRPPPSLPHVPEGVAGTPVGGFVLIAPPWFVVICRAHCGVPFTGSHPPRCDCSAPCVDIQSSRGLPHHRAQATDPQIAEDGLDQEQPQRPQRPRAPQQCLP